jgi:hypothetical protein
VFPTISEKAIGRGFFPGIRCGTFRHIAGLKLESFNEAAAFAAPKLW